MASSRFGKLSVLAVVFGAIAFFVTPPSATAELKVGVVSLQRALDQSNMGKDALKRIESAIEQAKSKVDRAEKEIARLSKELDAKRSTLKPEVALEKESVIRKKERELKLQRGDLNDSLAQMQSEIFKPMIAEVNKALRDHATEHGYDIILGKDSSPTDPPSVLYSAPAIDLTDEIVKRLDKNYKPAKK